jgi:hypothetical protein
MNLLTGQGKIDTTLWVKRVAGRLVLLLQNLLDFRFSLASQVFLDLLGPERQPARCPDVRKSPNAKARARRVKNPSKNMNSP